VIKGQTSTLHRKLQEAEEELRSLSGELLRAQDEERRRLARELHDATSQTLAALAINLGVVRKSAELTDEARNAIDDTFALVAACTREIRTLSYLLHPPMLDELGLDAALRGLVQGFTERSGVRVDLRLPPKLRDLPPDTALTLYRIVQESLTNVHRHSGSKQTSVRLAWEQGEIRLSVADRGHGMTRARLVEVETEPELSRRGRESRFTPSVGIPGMRERVKLLRGRIEIRSGKQGTTVAVAIPLGAAGPAVGVGIGQERSREPAHSGRGRS